MIVFGIFLVLETGSMFFFQNEIINFMTNIDDLRVELRLMFIMLVITVVPSGIRGSLRG